MTDSSTGLIELPPIRACLFDMDGLLIDTEDIYSEVTNTILREQDRPELPWSIKYQLQGRPGAAAIELFWKWAKLSKITQEEYLERSKKLQQELFPQCSPLPGVIRLLEHLKDQGIPMALATSSNTANYKLKTAHLKHLFDLIPADHHITGDDPRVPHGRGKPAPDIYLAALEQINVTMRKEGKPEIKPVECLVFEDAVTGVEAGRRAGMRVVWVPHPGLRDLFADQVEEVLAGVTGQIEHNPIQAEEARNGKLGQVGKIGDGMGEFRESLVGFDYARYGIRPLKKNP